MKARPSSSRPPPTWRPSISSLERALGRLDRDGPEVLDTDELLALLLAESDFDDDAFERARRVRDVSERLETLAKLRPSAFGARRTSLFPLHAGKVVAAFELGRRALAERTWTATLLLCDPLAVAGWADSRLAHLDHEEVWVLCVDGKSRLRSAWLAGRGGIHGCGLLPRDLLGPVVREGAAGFVLVHNHPSGDPTPSIEDRELTRALVEVATWLGTPLLDHVVVARGRFASFRELGLLEPSRSGDVTPDPRARVG